MNTVPDQITDEKLSSGGMPMSKSQSDMLSQEVNKLNDLLEPAVVPPELKEEIRLMIRRIANLYGSTAYAAEYEKVSNYLEWVVSLPWDSRSEDNLDLDKARQMIDTTHYGMEQVKERIIEYLAVMNLQYKKRDEYEKSLTNQADIPVDSSGNKIIPKKPQFRNNILFLVGLPGIGKTSVAKSIAEALNKEFVRIPFGGLASAVLLRGQSKVFPEAEPGLVIKNLRRAKTKNPVILLDEIDRAADSARAEIMGVLLELLDPEQNNEFRDHYIDYPFDLSEAMFICSGNNTGGVANAVLDRLEVIQMPSYTDMEKLMIARNYLFPREKENVGLSDDDIQIDEEVWRQIIRPLGFDAGVRTLSRTIQGICRIVAKKMVLGEGKSFRITEENVKDFLPKW